MPKFKRHFRIYFKNNHPVYIVDEEGNEYIFHRITHSTTSGGRKNWMIADNPIEGEYDEMYIVKKQEHEKKGRFSLFELKIKKGRNISFPFIKRMPSNENSNKIIKKPRKKAKKNAGRTQAISRITISSSKNIKKQKDHKVNND